MNQRPRTTIVGAGNISLSVHLPVFKRLGVDVQTIIDPSPVALKRAHRFFPQATYLSRIEPDAHGNECVLIASPTALHAEQVEHYLRAGAHVLCEKPLATDAAVATTLVKLAQEKNAVLRVGYVRRYHEASQTIKLMIADQRFGPLETITVVAGHQAAGLPASMMNPKLAGGGVTIDFGVHVLDSLRFWLDEPLHLRSYADNNLGGIESDSYIQLHGTHKGQTIPIDVQLSRTIDLGYVALVVFREAMVRYEFDTGYALHVLPRQQPPTSASPYARLEQVAPPTDAYAYFARQWQDFESSITGQKSALADLGSAVEVTRLVAEAYGKRQPLKFAFEELFSTPL